MSTPKHTRTGYAVAAASDGGPSLWDNARRLRPGARRPGRVEDGGAGGAAPGPSNRLDKPILGVDVVVIATRFGEITRFDLARTLLGRGRYWTTAYLVDGMMVDSGCRHTALELGRVLEGEEVTHLVNTHTHEDHIGGNETVLRLNPAVETIAHPLALRVLRDPRREQPLHPYRHVMWGMPRPSDARAAADGEVIETAHHRFRVVFTPGHSDDHLCLFEPDAGWAFTGDLFVGGSDRALRVGGDAWAIAASLRRIAALRPTLLLPGAAKVRDEAVPALLEKAAYLEELGGRVVEMHRRGVPEAEIVRATCGGPMLIELVTLGHFSRRGLVRSFLRGVRAADPA
jgi:glyoxylase-like metal-dependent hydrolase (beta-lactamase superfamily II)